MFTPHPPPPPSALALLNGEEYMIIFLFPSFTPDRLLWLPTAAGATWEVWLKQVKMLEEVCLLKISGAKQEHVSK